MRGAEYKADVQGTQGTIFRTTFDADRSPRLMPELFCGVLFYATLLVYLVLSVTILASKNAEIADIEGECPSGYRPARDCEPPDRYYSYFDGWCVDDSLCTDINHCLTRRRLEVAGAHAGNRSLADGSGPPLRSPLAPRALNSDDLDVPDNVWEFLEAHAYQPVTLFTSAMVCSAAWLFFMQKHPRLAVWGTIAAELVMLLFIGFWYASYELYAVAGYAFAAALIVILVAGWARANIDNVCVVIKAAMDGLAANKRLFAVSFAITLSWGGFFGLWLAGLITMHFIKEVKEEDGYCELAGARWATRPEMWGLWIAVYYWVTHFLRNVNLMMVAANVSGWFFLDPGYCHFWVKALKWSVGYLAGGNAMAASLTGIMAYLRARVKCARGVVVSLLFPWHWPGLILALILVPLLQAVTRYALVAHVFSREPFYTSCKEGFWLLKSKLGEALLTDHLANRIMSWMMFSISVGVGLSAWAWANDVQGLDRFTDIPAAALVWIVIMYVNALSYPLLCFVLVILLESLFERWGVFDCWVDDKSCWEVRGWFNSILASLFMASVAQLMLQTVAHVVVSACDVIFFCFAVESAAGAPRQDERFHKLYDSIKISIADGKVSPAGHEPTGCDVVMGNQPGMQTITVTMPADAVPGAEREIDLPGGGKVLFTVPAGTVPGQEVMIQVPVGAVPAEPGPAGNAVPHAQMVARVEPAPVVRVVGRPEP